MRIVFLALSLAAIPSPSLAACQCACVEGTSVARCSQATDVAPICQNLCLPSVQLPSVDVPGGRSVRGGTGFIDDRDNAGTERGNSQPPLFTPQR